MPEFSVNSDGVLCRTMPALHDESGQQLIPVLPRAMILTVLYLLHDTTGHMGVRKTLVHIRRRFVWKHMAADVKNYIRGCVTCQRVKSSVPHHHGLLKPASTLRPWQQLSVDFVGPLPVSHDHKWRYVIVMEDLFTRYIEMKGTTDCTAETAAEAVFSAICLRYGVPETILTDQGSSFEATLFRSLCRYMDIRKIRTTAYRPQSNGAVERTNRTTGKALACLLLQKSPTFWDRYLPVVSFHYNCSYHSAIKTSPFRVLFGAEPRLPIDLLFGPKQDLRGDVPGYMAEMLEEYRVLYERVLSANEEAKVASKKLYDQTHQTVDFLPGSLVLVYSPILGNRHRSKKFLIRWSEPMTVVQKVSSLLFRVRDAVTAQEKIVHVARIRRFDNAARLQLENLTEPEYQQMQHDQVEEKSLIEASDVVSVPLPPEPAKVDLPAGYYRIEAIVGRRKAGRGYQYLVQWAGFPGEDTWEPSGALANVQDLIQEYNKVHPLKAAESATE